MRLIKLLIIKIKVRYYKYRWKRLDTDHKRLLISRGYWPNNFEDALKQEAGLE